MTIECLEFKTHKSGTLQGFASFRIPKMGVDIFGCAVFMKDGRRWIILPSREYLDKETGEKKYMGTMKFIEKGHMDLFCKAALTAIDEWCSKNDEARLYENKPSANDNEEIPF